MRTIYESILEAKYKYQGDVNKMKLENYVEPEEQKGLSNSDSFALQQTKLKSTNQILIIKIGQDAQIEEYINLTKKGKGVAKEINNEIEVQNKLLDSVDKDVII